ncbi:MAG: hypothetical protein AB1757_09625 [Acidobacteriota bacterium]
MNNRKNIYILMAFLLILTSFNHSLFAQRAYRVSDREMQNLLNRIETRATQFRSSLDQAIDRSSLNGTQREDEINQYVRDFDVAIARLAERFRDRRDVAADVEEVINRGWSIDYFMRNNYLSGAQSDWNLLRIDLRRLAGNYNVAWVWDSRNSLPPYYQANINNRNQRFMGTYTLDTSRSDNVAYLAEQAARQSTISDTARIRRVLERRLSPPDSIALEQTGRQFVMASTTSPQVDFIADGIAKTETRPNGRTVRTTATLRGNQLVIASTGDRGSDFTVTFERIENGNALRVTREIYLERLNRPVISRSIYRKTSEIAQLNLFDGNRNRPGINDDNRFVFPRGTVFSAILNDEITTRQARVGDRFTMRISSPSQFAGAEIEGHVAKVDRASRLTGRSELALEFDRIRLQNGRSYNFDGYIEEIRTTNGDRVSFDNEGIVREDDSQTGRTVRNTGIGAAIGAILGGLLGGGEGAVVGAVVGGGAGVGSVILQGRDDLNLTSGTEFRISSAIRTTVSSR